MCRVDIKNVIQNHRINQRTKKNVIYKNGHKICGNYDLLLHNLMFFPSGLGKDTPFLPSFIPSPTLTTKEGINQNLGTKIDNNFYPVILSTYFHFVNIVFAVDGKWTTSQVLHLQFYSFSLAQNMNFTILTNQIDIAYFVKIKLQIFHMSSSLSTVISTNLKKILNMYRNSLMNSHFYISEVCL